MMAEIDFSANVERFSGFADLYDRYRPHPPVALADLLVRLSGGQVPELVVDLGCGTGLSTRYWADKARHVVGIEPSADMRRQAESYTSPGDLSYREGFSHVTGLADACADIVTCSQALHWMEPQGTFREAVRILRPGGVFAAYDYDWPPATGHWRADQAFQATLNRARQLQIETGAEDGIQRWEKSGHLARMRASGCFRYVNEVVIHQIEPGNAERLSRLMYSQGGIMSLLKKGVSAAEIGLDELERFCKEELGDISQNWYWSSRIRFGIK
jgi:SAM-dependent methyltransferase